MKFLLISALIFAGCGSDKKNERSPQPEPQSTIELTDGDNCLSNHDEEFCKSYSPVEKVSCKKLNEKIFKLACSNENPECKGECEGFTPQGAWYPVPILGSEDDGSKDTKLRCQC